MSLTDHARAELKAAGLFDKDSDYDGMLGDAVMELVEKFADQGHSGFSAHLTLDIFATVAAYKPLGPITTRSEEWMHIADDVAGQPNLWQNTRRSSSFSTDGGKTFYDIDDRWHWPRWRRIARRLKLPVQTYRTRSAEPHAA
jgi:hypothetical protein